MAWATLDAQYFGVAQRRRRVFVLAVPCELVERLGAGADPAEILSIGQCLRWDTPTRGGAGEGAAGGAALSVALRGREGGGTAELGDDLQNCLRASSGGGDKPHVLAFGGNNTAGPIDVATARNACASASASGRMDFESETFLVQPIAAYSSSVAGYWREGIGALRGRPQDSHENVCCVTGEITHTLKAEGFDASEDGTGRGTPLVPVGVTIHGTDPTVQKVASLDETAQCLRARTPGNIDNSSTTVVMQPVSFAIQAGALRTNPLSGPDGIGVQADHAYTLEARAEVQAVAFSCKDYGSDAGELSPTLRAMGHGESHANAGGQVAVAFAENSRAEIRLEGGDGKRTGALSAGGGKPGQGVPMIVGPMTACGGTENKHGFGWGQQDWENGYCQPTASMQVRRLTPRECERLQGFPDDYTLIPWRKKPATDCPDGPRYKALGNSWAVPVVSWIGRRIQEAINGNS